MGELIPEGGIKAEQSQRKVLGKRETEISRFQRLVRGLLSTIPVEVAQTDPGSKLLEALQGVEDYLTTSRSLIRRETAPLEGK